MPKIGRSATTCSLSSRRCSPAVGTGGLMGRPDVPEGDSLACKRGEVCSRGGAPVAADVDFCQDLGCPETWTPRRKMQAMAPLARGAGSSLLGLGFCFWVWLVRGSFYP